MTTSEKTCFKCGETKPLSDFYRHKAMSDGHLGKCKECAKHDARNHRSANLERVRAYDRTRSKQPHRRAHIARNAAKWRRANPKGYRAHGAVNNAIRTGTLTREPCEVCGAREVHAHHDDYNKPLDVRWLCVRCHAGHHKYIRNS